MPRGLELPATITMSRGSSFSSRATTRDLADCIILLKSDRALRDQLVSNGAKYVQGNNWAVKKREYLELVDSMISERQFASKPAAHFQGQ